MQFGRLAAEYPSIQRTKKRAVFEGTHVPDTHALPTSQNGVHVEDVEVMQDLQHSPGTSEGISPVGHTDR